MANLDELRRVLLEMASPNTLRDCVVTLLDDVRGLVTSRERHRDTQVVHHARIDQLAYVSSDTRQRIESLTGEQSLHRMALDEHGERLATLAAQFAGLQRLVESLVNERGEMRQEVEELHAALGEPTTSTTIVGQLRAEVERLTRERDEASKTRDAFEVERAGLRQLVADMCQWIQIDYDVDAGIVERLDARERLLGIVNATKEQP